MTNKLFLDVDGVLNADDHQLRWPDTANTTVLINRGGGYRDAFRISWSPTMVAELAALVDTFDVVVVWVTTWCEGLAVRKIEAALGWAPEGALIAPFNPAFPEDPHSRDAWKRDVVSAHLDGGDTAVWVDDDVVPVYGAEAKAAAASIGAKLLTLAPPSSPQVGLTAEDLAAMRAHFA